MERLFALHNKIQSKLQYKIQFCNKHRSYGYMGTISIVNTPIDTSFVRKSEISIIYIY